MVRAANWGKLVKERSKDVADSDELDSALGMEPEFENIPEQDTQSQSEAGEGEEGDESEAAEGEEGEEGEEHLQCVTVLTHCGLVMPYRVKQLG